MVVKKQASPVKPTKTATLVGFARKSKAGNGLKLALDVNTLADSPSYTGKDGVKRVQVVMNLERLVAVIEGKREVAALTVLHDE